MAAMTRIYVQGSLIPEVAQRLEQLDEKKKTLTTLCMRMMQADGGKAFSLDLLAMAVFKRALAVAGGFRALVKQTNFLCAAALVRLQMDSALRFVAASLVDDPHDLARRVMAGEHIRKIPDRHGKKMTDRYLLGEIAKVAPWARDAYDKASGFVHLSDVHMFSPVTRVGNRRVSLAIGEQDSHVHPTRWIELVSMFNAATDLVVWAMESWTQTKERAAEGGGQPTPR